MDAEKKQRDIYEYESNPRVNMLAQFMAGYKTFEELNKDEVATSFRVFKDLLRQGKVRRA